MISAHALDAKNHFGKLRLGRRTVKQFRASTSMLSARSAYLPESRVVSLKASTMLSIIKSAGFYITLSRRVLNAQLGTLVSIGVHLGGLCELSTHSPRGSRTDNNKGALMQSASFCFRVRTKCSADLLTVGTGRYRALKHTKQALQALDPRRECYFLHFRSATNCWSMHDISVPLVYFGTLFAPFKKTGIAQFGAGIHREICRHLRVHKGGVHARVYTKTPESSTISCCLNLIPSLIHLRCVLCHHQQPASFHSFRPGLYLLQFYCEHYLFLSQHGSYATSARVPSSTCSFTCEYLSVSTFLSVSVISTFYFLFERVLITNISLIGRSFHLSLTNAWAYSTRRPCASSFIASKCPNKLACGLVLRRMLRVR